MIGNTAKRWVRQMIRHPRGIVPAILCRLKRLRIKRVERDGELFYSYKGVLYPAYLLGGNASSYILPKAQEYCVGSGIDVGANDWPVPGAVPVDNSTSENAYRLDRFPSGSLDYVFSSHCLEHLRHWQDALRLWISKLREGGILFLYLPHISCEMWVPGGPWVADAHVWSPTWEILVPFLEAEGMEILELDKGRDAYWSFHIVARRLN